VFHRIACFLTTFALFVVLGETPAPLVAQTPPDLIVVLTDDMRADDWPILADTQRLVGGTEFPNFVFNTPLCCPFRASFQRGQMAHNTGIKTNGDAPRFAGLDGDTLATALDGVGYHTAYVGRFLNGYDRRAPGWDVWDVIPGTRAAKARYQWRGGYVTDTLTASAVDAIATAPADTPLFLMVGHVAPHAPWTPAPEYAQEDVGPTINRDDANRKRTLLSVDDSTEDIAAAMGDRWASACVVVLTDNGWLIDEHGTSGKSHWWDEATRVPMRIRCPGIADGVDRRMASTVDVPATLLAAAGASMEHPLDGQPLQENWQRAGVLVESWDQNSVGKSQRRLPFTAIKGEDFLYVEPKGKAPRYYRMPDEAENVIATLPRQERQRLADWLAALRTCAGANCQ
jgi:arylsulfatase A-like enzyme